MMNEPMQLELACLKREWIEDATKQFALIAPNLGTFTFDDLHPLLPTPEHPNWFGVLAARLRNSGKIFRVNAIPSQRPEANGRLISVWRVA